MPPGRCDRKGDAAGEFRVLGPIRRPYRSRAATTRAGFAVIFHRLRQTTGNDREVRVYRDGFDRDILSGSWRVRDGRLRRRGHICYEYVDAGAERAMLVAEVYRRSQVAVPCQSARIAGQ